MDRGVNFVDTAYPYHNGSSEVALGKALKEGYRDKVKISDKSPVSKIKDKGDFERYLYKQLERLQVNFLDYYLLHGLNRDRWLNIVGRFNLLHEAEKAKQEGLIKHLGFSFHDCVFRPHPDTHFGIIRTAFRNYPDNITAHSDTLSCR